MNDFTLLGAQDIWDEYKQLDIIKKYGTKAAITDFAVLSGGVRGVDYCFTNEGDTIENATCEWWTKTPDFDYCGEVTTVWYNGVDSFKKTNTFEIGIRPVLLYSSIKLNSSNIIREVNGIKEINYGEYPQTVAKEDQSYELEKAYNNKNILSTDKVYTINLPEAELNESDNGFKARTFKEYEYNGNKYIRLIGDNYYDLRSRMLSNAKIVQEGKPYWIKVEPIIWLIDEKKDLMLSKKAILSGIPFSNKRRYDYCDSFNQTAIKWFMDTYLSKDIVPSITYNLDNTNNQRTIKIKNLITKIKKYYNGINYDLEKQINSRIDYMVETYNKKMESIKQNSNPFNLTLETEETIYIDLYTKLLSLEEKSSKFYDLYSLLNNYINILNKKEISNNLDSLGQDLKTITDVIIPFINDDSYKTKIIKILTKYKYLLQDIIRNDKYIPFTKEKLIIDIRSDLHEILIDIANIVHTKSYNDTYNHILNANESFILENENYIIKLYLNRIYNTSNNIKSMTTNELYLNRLNEILNFNIDNVKDINETINILTNVLNKLYELEYDVNFSNKKELNNYRIRY